MLLQEVLPLRAAQPRQDQPALLAEALDTQVVYAPVILCERPGLSPREYGVAVLTSLPSLFSQTLPLPGEIGTEPRVALRVVVQTHRGPLVTVTTHLAPRATSCG